MAIIPADQFQRIVRDVERARGDRLFVHKIFGEEIIVRTTYTVSLKIDIDPEDKATHEAAVAEIKIAAQVVFAQVSLLQLRRAPQIALTTDNSFMGTQAIEAFDPDAPTA